MIRPAKVSRSMIAARSRGSVKVWVVTVVGLLEFGGWDVAAGGVQAAVVEPRAR
jgi:hypothetical protein